MANSQLQTYRYSQLTEQALALKRLCDTGFGPADICPKAGASADGALTANSADLPTVEEISGTRTGLSAVVAFPDGSHFTVRNGSVLPNGLAVVAITDDDVRVGKSPGRETILSFGGSARAK
jgi:type IV pilus biogenesis protein PilP